MKSSTKQLHLHTGKRIVKLTLMDFRSSVYFPLSGVQTVAYVRPLCELMLNQQHLKRQINVAELAADRHMAALR